MLFLEASTFPPIVINRERIF